MALFPHSQITANDTHPLVAAGGDQYRTKGQEEMSDTVRITVHESYYHPDALTIWSQVWPEHRFNQPNDYVRQEWMSLMSAALAKRDAMIAELTATLAGRYDLKALELCADAATTEAETQITRFEGEAINWGDLGCVGAEWYVGADDNTGYRVWIEEADPASYRLRDFIREHLARHGFVDVDVMLEW